MKKRIVMGVMILTALTFCGCQAMARKYGGDIEIKLEPGEKLEEITWKDANLWYLVRPMREGETAETHVFKESSNYNLNEGSVTVIESEVK